MPAWFTEKKSAVNLCYYFDIDCRFGGKHLSFLVIMIWQVASDYI